MEPAFIASSKQTCASVYQIDPYEIPHPHTILTAKQLKENQEKYKDIISLSKFYMQKLLTYMKGVSTLIAISDEQGYIIDVFGDDELNAKLGLKPGSLYDEKSMGTNSISFSLEQNRPVQVIGDQHYHYVLHGYSCSSCPFQLPYTNEIGGTISIMTEVDHASPFHLGLLSTTVDAIERELELQKQNKQLHILNQVLINSNHNGIIITDRKGKMIECNDFAQSLIQKQKTDILNKTVYQISPFGTYLYDVLHNGRKYENIEVTFTTNKQTDKTICIMDVLPIYAEGQKLIGAYCQFRDITERYQLEQQMIANERLSAIGKLSAGLAHEIRNPLTPITGFIQLLHQNTEKSEETNRYFHIVFSELERIKTLVNDFVLMAKPETPKKKHCHIEALLRETVELMSSAAKLHDIEIDILIENLSDPFLFVDEKQIKQVFINLLQNAMDVTKKGDQIDILVKRDPTGFKIGIKDRGKGMTSDEQKQLFTPFYTTKTDGVGLGLSICERIIKNHYGTITVHSALHEGTTFEIYLPSHAPISENNNES